MLAGGWAKLVEALPQRSVAVSGASIQANRHSISFQPAIFRFVILYGQMELTERTAVAFSFNNLHDKIDLRDRQSDGFCRLAELSGFFGTTGTVTFLSSPRTLIREGGLTPKILVANKKCVREALEVASRKRLDIGID